MQKHDRVFTMLTAVSAKLEENETAEAREANELHTLPGIADEEPAEIQSIVVVSAPPQPRERAWSVPICCFVATLLSLMVGITISFPSNVTLDLSENTIGLSQDHLLSTFLQSAYAALAYAGAMLGGPVGGWITDRWGRKCAMMFCGVPYLVGYMCQSYAHYAPAATTFKAILLTGRFISGVGMGWATVTSVYISEMSSTKLRGLYGTLFEASVLVGVTLNYALGSIHMFYYFDVALVTVGIVALFEVLMIWFPDTPRSLLSRGYVKEAEKVLKWLRGPDGDRTAIELNEIKLNIIASRRHEKRLWRVMTKGNVLLPFSYLLIVFAFKQFCGINVIFSYAGDLFVNAGVPNPRDTAIYAVGAANITGVLIAFLVIDRIGRKVLLIISGVLMAVGSTMLGTHFYITRPSLCDDFLSASNISLASSGSEIPSDDTTDVCNLHFGPLAIVSLIVYNCGFSLGWGPIPWILLSEFLPISVRGLAGGICTVFSWLLAAVVVGLYLEYAELVNPWFAMWTFAVFSIASSVFVLIVIPETKGRSLEEMERVFEKILSKCRI